MAWDKRGTDGGLAATASLAPPARHEAAPGVTVSPAHFIQAALLALTS